MSTLTIIVPLCDMISTFPPLLLSLIRLLELVFSHLWVLVLRAVASGSLFSGEREIERGSRQKANERRRGRQRANGEIEGKL